MHLIGAHFERFCDVPLPELIGATGVYVVWDSQTIARPTYIGEGNVLRRLANHVAHADHRFAFPWDGYVALFEGSSRAVHKNEARAVERLLLDVANDTDRPPKVNAHPGAAAVVERYCARYTLRVALTGYDPLIPPREARLLRKAKHIWADRTAVGYDFDHDWRLRRLRVPRWPRVATV